MDYKKETVTDGISGNSDYNHESSRNTSLCRQFLFSFL